MPIQLKVIKPDPRENKTTIQVSKEIKEILTRIGLKGETYNNIISRLISNFQKDNKELSEADKIKPTFGQVKIGENITISKYERATISVNDKISLYHPYVDGPSLTLEISYNNPINKDDELYQVDLKIEKVIFDNEAYSPKEFFGVLQKDMVYCEEFVYYYLRSILEIIRIEFKKSNFFFKIPKDYLELARWRTFLLNSRLSPEILSSDVESILSDLKNEKTNKKLLEDVKNSIYNQIKEYGRIR